MWSTWPYFVIGIAVVVSVSSGSAYGQTEAPPLLNFQGRVIGDSATVTFVNNTGGREAFIDRWNVTTSAWQNIARVGSGTGAYIDRSANPDFPTYRARIITGNTTNWGTLALDTCHTGNPDFYRYEFDQNMNASTTNSIQWAVSQAPTYNTQVRSIQTSPALVNGDFATGALSYQQDWTIGFWIKQYAEASGTGYIVTWDGAPGTTGYTGVTQTGGVYYFTAEGTHVIRSDTGWDHIVMVRDSDAQTISFYVDGTLSWSKNVGEPTDYRILNVGSQYNTVYMDDLTMCMGHAADALEVSRLYTYKLRTSAGLPPQLPYLDITALTPNTVRLEWPELNSESILSYFVNYCTPACEMPSVPLAVNLPTNVTTYNVTSLAPATSYSFTVGYVADGSKSIDDPVASVQTPYTNLQIGDTRLGARNNDRLDMRFTTTQGLGNDTHVRVLYEGTPQIPQISCRVDFRVGNTTSIQYNNLMPNTGPQGLYNDFQFTQTTGNIAALSCWYNDDVGNERTVTVAWPNETIPIIQQIRGLQDGTYGGVGKIGGVDFVVLACILVTMIGFQKKQPSVGGIMASAMMGVLTWFGLVDSPTVMYGALTVVTILALTTTKRSFR